MPDPFVKHLRRNQTPAEARLVIEVDGPSHDQTVGEDESRTRRLESQGYRVLRFPNAQVLTDLDSVVRTIEAVLLGHISLEPPETIPPPLVGGGEGAGSGAGRRP